MLDPPGAYTSERARAMITIQAASESTTIEKIAARNEKRSVRRLSVTQPPPAPRSAHAVLSAFPGPFLPDEPRCGRSS